MKSRYLIQLCAGASLIALCPTFAHGQVANPSKDDAAATAAPSELEEIVVVGIRKSLIDAQTIKQNADVFVDAVTAADISALPDKSVTEALQRVPGVSITRFASFTDSDHFTVEGSGTVVRGLDNVRSEINGRDVFSASGAQGISWNAISPELIGSIEVYKNQSADMIEGGMAGTINLGIRKPFDFEGQRIALNGQFDYGDMAKKATPTVSGLYSNRWDTSIGEFGMLVGGVYSELQTQSQASGTRRWLQVDGPNGGKVWTTREVNIRETDYNRVRDSQAAALQWKNLDSTLDATFQFFRSSYENAWDENTLESDTGVNTAIQPAPGTSFRYNENGVFEGGTLTLGDQGQRGSGKYGVFPRQGFGLTNASRGAYDDSTTTDYGFNLKWDATDRLHLQFDAQYVKSERSAVDFTLGQQAYANAEVDFTGSMPRVKFLSPPDATLSGDKYFGSLDSWYPAWAMDHMEAYDADALNLRADAKYEFDDDSWLRSVRVGARMSDRDQMLRNSNYNWNFLSQSWVGDGQVAFSNALLPKGLFGIDGFDKFLRRDAATTGLGQGFGQWIGPSLGKNYEEAAAAVYQVSKALAAAGGGNWRPLAMRDGVVAGTAFLPGEMTRITEDSDAFYARADFADPSDRLAANVGVRVVQTTATSDGFVGFPNGNEIRRDGSGNIRTVANYCAPPRTDGTPLRINNVAAPCIRDFVITDPVTGAGGFPNGFAKTEEFFRWANGTTVPSNFKHKYTRWLPSLNMRYKIEDGLLARFGMSRALTRPNFSDLASTFNFDTGRLFTSTRTWSGPSSGGGNVNLNPMMSDQVDFAIERYFGPSTSLTGTVFYKRLKSTIVNQYVSRPIENNGVTLDVRLDSKGNQEKTANIKGFEVAYQQTFEMLPGPFLSALGMQANYTYLQTDASPVLAVNLSDTGVLVPVDVSPLARQGLSKHTLNLVGFYDKDGFTARFAYNWRSQYLLDPRDLGEPYYPIRAAAAGYLDASVSYSITPDIRVGIEGSNLTNTKSRTYKLVNNDFLQTPRNMTIADRRFSTFVRANF